MINKIISTTKLFRMQIVKSVCESLDLGTEGGHLVVVVGVFFDGGSIHRAYTVSCSPNTPQIRQ